jgi:PIN domain nuclease of toxin-antitoxin system
MTFMLDTHLILWAAFNDPLMPAKAAEIIEDEGHRLAFSSLNIWEVVIKSGLGRTDFRIDPHALRAKMLKNGFIEIHISSDHVLAVATLPKIHRDPFDRLLIAQASVEGFDLLTADPVVASYPGRIIKV